MTQSGRAPGISLSACWLNSFVSTVWPGLDEHHLEQRQDVGVVVDEVELHFGPGLEGAGAQRSGAEVSIAWVSTNRAAAFVGMIK